MAFMQGYISTLTVGTVPVEVYSSSATITYTTNAIDVTTLGLANKVYINGLKDGTIEWTMHADTEGLGLLWSAHESTVAVAYVFRPGALGGPDAGQWAGECVVTSYSVVGAVDDNWVLELSGQLTGVPQRTEPV